MDSVTLYLQEDELYPFYVLHEQYGTKVQVTEEFAKKYRKVTNAFFEVQKELAKLQENVNG